MTATRAGVGERHGRTAAMERLCRTSRRTHSHSRWWTRLKLREAVSMSAVVVTVKDTVRDCGEHMPHICDGYTRVIRPRERGRGQRTRLSM